MSVHYYDKEKVVIGLMVAEEEEKEGRYEKGNNSRCCARNGT